MMMKNLWRGVLSALIVALPLGLSGCGDFFQCAKASCTTSTSSSTSGNYAYVSNSSTGQTYINGYVLTSGTLVATTSSPYSLNYTPSAMAVSTSNKFLYVGSNTGLVGTGVSAIYGYTIGTGGALTILNSGSVLINSNVAAMDVSPDGQWLLVLTTYDGVNPVTVTAYNINASTGLLSFASSQQVQPVTNQVPVPSAVRVSPNAGYVAVALGAGGIATFPFTTSTGAFGNESLISINLTPSAVYGLAIDTNNYLYAALPGNVVTIASTAAGVLAATSISYATGNSLPTSVAISGTSYVYSGSTTTTTTSTTTTATSSLYSYTNAGSGKLTSIGNVSAPTGVQRLAVDSTSKYLLAAGISNTSGVQMYTIGSSGALTLSSSVATGTVTNSQTVMALTH